MIFTIAKLALPVAISLSFSGCSWLLDKNKDAPKIQQYLLEAGNSELEPFHEKEIAHGPMPKTSRANK
jgi:hypothetical protein